MVRIKICGIKKFSDLDILLKNGVDAIGTVVNVPKSPRNLSIKQALLIREKIPPFISHVCVTISNNVEDLVKIQKIIKPDVFQVHAFKEESFFKNVREIVRSKLILALHLDKKGNSKIIHPDPIRASKILSSYCDALLVDSFSVETMGGSGIQNDFKLVKKVKDVINVPLILSGGLTPNNVIDAINLVNPYAVDVSSGVESSPGIKDEKLMVQFIKNVKGLI
ncbi:MAG: phosphoribosylanthranilate isomerase [Candidatus Helarchaeota archaeon]